MKLFKKESKQKKETRSLPMGKKSRSAFAVYAALVLMLCCCTTTAFAASDPLTVINNLSDFIFGLIRAVGTKADLDGDGYEVEVEDGFVTKGV